MLVIMDEIKKIHMDTLAIAYLGGNNTRTAVIEKNLQTIARNRIII